MGICVSAIHIGNGRHAMTTAPQRLGTAKRMERREGVWCSGGVECANVVPIGFDTPKGYAMLNTRAVLIGK